MRGIYREQLTPHEIDPERTRTQRDSKRYLQNTLRVHYATVHVGNDNGNSNSNQIQQQTFTHFSIYISFSLPEDKLSVRSFIYKSLVS